MDGFGLDMDDRAFGSHMGRLFGHVHGFFQFFGFCHHLRHFLFGFFPEVAQVKIAHQDSERADHKESGKTSQNPMGVTNRQSNHRKPEQDFEQIAPFHGVTSFHPCFRWVRSVKRGYLK